MSLTNRFLFVFQTTLAVVLAGFSLTLYLLTRSHLDGLLDGQLDSALNTLVAAAEIRPGGVEWEPAERQLTFRAGALGEQVVWLVSDTDGKFVDQLAGPLDEDFLKEVDVALRNGFRPNKRMDWQGDRWQFRQRWIDPIEPLPTDAALQVNHLHARLSIVVGTPLAPTRSTLRWMGGTLVGLSIGIWCFTLLIGRAVCRRGLLPLRHMADAAGAIHADDIGRLPSSRTGDELEELSGSFNRLLDRLQESFERQRQFTGEASHQLRTPLAAVLGQVEVALRRERSPEEYQRVLSSVYQQSARLSKIVEALLFLSRADSEARLPNREFLDLQHWLVDHLRNWTTHPRANDLQIGSTEESVRVFAHSELLGELIDILLDNACKYTISGSPIAINVRNTATSVEFIVEDNGDGISIQELPNIFRPFFRGQSSRQKGIEGAGLGLAIAKRLAAAFGGELTAESRIGHGSRFKLSLPPEQSTSSVVCRI